MSVLASVEARSVQRSCRLFLASYVLNGYVGAELHRLVDDFTTARAQSNGGDQRRDNDHVLDLHSLLS